MCCAGGRGGWGTGTGGWAPALGVGARRGSTPGCWPALPSRPPSGARPTGRRAVVWAFAHGPPAPRVAAAASCGTGGGGGGARALGATARVSGQRSVGRGSVGLLCRARPHALRRWRTPTARVSAASALSSIGGDGCPPYALLRGGWGGGGVGGAQGRGARACRGGSPGHRSGATPLCSLSGVRGPPCWASGHCCQVWPSPAPPLAWGLGLRRRLIPRAVAPVAEGGAQVPR